MRKEVNRSIILGLFVLGLFLLSPLNPSTVHPNFSSPQLVVNATGSSTVDYVVFIVMENHGLSQIIGSRYAPYMNQLANDYSLARKYTAVAHPSLPNYLALLGGSTFGCNGFDSNPNSDSCTRGAWSSTNLVDRLEAKGLRWKAYMENMTSNCQSRDSGGYIAHHNPFVYFSDIAMNPTRCGRVIPAGAADITLLNDLNSAATASNLMWLTPNNCNNMHDCSVSTGDNYLASLVPKILSSPLFTSQKAALFIAFDEGNQNPPGDYVFATLAGPGVARNYQSIADYNHYSFLKTLETFWGLDSLSIGDAQAKPMLEFFTSHQLETKFTYAPITPLTNHSVTLAATTSGGMSPFSYVWTFNNTLTTAVGQSVKHTFVRAGPYNVSLSVTDAVNKVAKTFKIVTVTDLPLSLRPLFTYSPLGPVTEQNITFTGQARGGAFPYAYNWIFGDSKTDSGEIVYHAYNSPGTFNVSLTIVDSRLKTNSTSMLVNITDVSSLSSSVTYSPATPLQGENITFTATTTGGNQPYDYRWDLGDGSQATGAIVHHGYSRSGTFNVTLTTTDQDANTASTPITVVVRTSSGQNTSRCWYCVWNAIPLPLPFLLIAVTFAALLATGVVVARVRIRRK